MYTQYSRRWSGDTTGSVIVSLSWSTTLHVITSSLHLRLPHDPPTGRFFLNESASSPATLPSSPFFSHLQSWITYIFLAPGARHVISAFLSLSSSGGEGWKIRQRFISACSVTVKPFALIPHCKPENGNDLDRTVKTRICGLRDVSGSSFTLESLIHQRNHHPSSFKIHAGNHLIWGKVLILRWSKKKFIRLKGNKLISQ